MAPSARRRLFRVAGVLAAVALGLAAIELVLALSPTGATFRSWREASITFELDAEVDWRLEPRVYSWGTINAFGFRGPAPEPRRDPGVFRVLALGGSSTFDLGKTDAETWPALLEKCLGTLRGRRVEVVNAGTPGWSSWQSRRLLAGRLASWDVDLILVDHVFNDLLTFRFADRAAIIEAWRVNARANEVSPWAHERPVADALSALLPRTVDRVRLALVRRDRAASHAEFVKTWRGQPRAISPAGPAFYEENLEALARLAAARGVPLALIAEPTLVGPDMSAEEHARLADWVQLPQAEHRRAWELAWSIGRRVAERHAGEGAFFVDAPARLPPERALFADEVHLTAAGSERLAAVVAEAVRDHVR